MTVKFSGHLELADSELNVVMSITYKAYHVNRFYNNINYYFELIHKQHSVYNMSSAKNIAELN